MQVARKQALINGLLLLLLNDLWYSSVHKLGVVRGQ